MIQVYIYRLNQKWCSMEAAVDFFGGDNKLKLVGVVHKISSSSSSNDETDVDKEHDVMIELDLGIMIGLSSGCCS